MKWAVRELLKGKLGRVVYCEFNIDFADSIAIVSYDCFGDEIRNNGTCCCCWWRRFVFGYLEEIKSYGQSNHQKVATVSLVFIFLVILAGSVCKSHGFWDGMLLIGPNVLGINIPPTDVETLTWREGKTFEEGQMILLEEHFWVAKSDLNN